MPLKTKSRTNKKNLKQKKDIEVIPLFFIIQQQMPNLGIARAEPSEFSSPEEFKKKMLNAFDLDVAFVKGVGPKIAQELHNIGVDSVGELYYYVKFSKRKRGKILDIFKKSPQGLKHLEYIMANENTEFIKLLRSYMHDRKVKSPKKRVIRNKQEAEGLWGLIENALRDYFGIRIE